MKVSDYWQQCYLTLRNSKQRKAFFQRFKKNLNRPLNSSRDIKKLHQQLTLDSAWSTDFILCTVISCLIASFGLLGNSTAVIIGAMLVAPLMLPLRGLAFSACEGDFSLFRKAMLSIIGATVVSLLLSACLAAIISLSELGSEVLSRTQPNLIDLGIAVTAGAMSGFGKIRTGISDTLAGTAIAVALMPPICVVGICLVRGDFNLAEGAFLLYFTNLLGITLACMIVFILAGYTKMNHAVGITTLLTLLLIIPLGASFLRLLEQQKLEKEVILKLTQETVTVGQDVESTDINVDWTAKRPIVYVTLQTDKEITSRQVKLTQKYINRRLDKNFELILLVSPLTKITGEDQTQDTQQPPSKLKPNR